MELGTISELHQQLQNGTGSVSTSPLYQNKNDYVTFSSARATMSTAYIWTGTKIL